METKIDEKNNAENLANILPKYLENQWEFIRLIAAEKAIKFINSSFSFLLFLFFSTLSFIFCSIALALYLGKIFENLSLGFFIVAMLLIVLMLVLYVLGKKSFERKVSKLIIQLLNNEEHGS